MTRLSSESSNVSLKFYSIYLFHSHPETDACRNENGGDFGFLWISIDHIEMLLISTYRLMMFSHLKELSELLSFHDMFVLMCRQISHGLVFSGGR